MEEGTVNIKTNLRNDLKRGSIGWFNRDMAERKQGKPIPNLQQTTTARSTSVKDE